MWNNKISSLILLSLVSPNFGCGKTADDTGDTGDTSETTYTLTGGIESELVNYGGCGDIFMYAGSTSDNAGLFISASGLVEEAFSLDVDTSSFTLDVGLDDGQARVTLQAGVHITTEACNDAIVPGYESVVSQEIIATGGTLTFQITPNGEPTEWGEFPAGGEVLLNNVEFTTADGESLVIDNWGFSAFVGWLPG